MRHHSNMNPVDWVKRINRSWIVHNNLNDRAEQWVDYLIENDDTRLDRSCRMAKAMCELREPLDDPKPWFYAGLFNLASHGEAHKFLDTHRVTKATVPCMAEEESVKLWVDRISPETRELLDRLHASLATAREQM